MYVMLQPPPRLAEEPKPSPAQQVKKSLWGVSEGSRPTPPKNQKCDFWLAEPPKDLFLTLFGGLAGTFARLSQRLFLDFLSMSWALF